VAPVADIQHRAGLAFRPHYQRIGRGVSGTRGTALADLDLHRHGEGCQLFKRFEHVQPDGEFRRDSDDAAAGGMVGARDRRRRVKPASSGQAIIGAEYGGLGSNVRI
jgi:hypothetical protein